MYDVNYKFIKHKLVKLCVEFIICNIVTQDKSKDLVFLKLVNYSEKNETVLTLKGID